MISIIKDISALTPKAQKACKLFLAECEAQGLKVRITETYRSQERQNELYAQGRTKAGSTVVSHRPWSSDIVRYPLLYHRRNPSSRAAGRRGSPVPVDPVLVSAGR